MLLEGHKPINLRPERWPIDLQFALRALDPDSRTGGIEAVGVSGDAEAGESDALGGVLAFAGRGGEVEQHGGFFVGAGGVLIHQGQDLGGFAVCLREGVVEGLEDPG